ncbi:1184_t:CDS:1 [Cetraspora pellucida]|uniref:1184_t:CDS:1 n=1 Tax=Cetraspora pellucida TaxID=1433469 RepID=A0ACA9NZS1_9GLOM|nr:1184_t:CDS:1 [Cetraspora pellucida]
MSAKNLELSMFTESLEPSQNPLFTHDVLSFPDRDFLDDSSGNETNTKKSDKRVFSKWHKSKHPLWSYFYQSKDNKYIYCNLCDTKYGNRSGISTIKRHFESNHKSKYQKYHKSSSMVVEHYGPCDEQKVKKLNGLLV